MVRVSSESLATVIKSRLRTRGAAVKAGHDGRTSVARWSDVLFSLEVLFLWSHHCERLVEMIKFEAFYRRFGQTDDRGARTRTRALQLYLL